MLRIRDGVLSGSMQESMLLVGLRLHGSLALVDAVHASTKEAAAAAVDLLPFGACLVGAYAATREAALRAISICKLDELPPDKPPGPIVIAYAELSSPAASGVAFELQAGPGAPLKKLQPQEVIGGLAASPEGLSEELGLMIARSHVTLPIDVYTEVDAGSAPSAGPPAPQPGPPHKQPHLPGPSFLKALSCAMTCLEHKLATASAAFVATKPDGQRLLLTPSGCEGTVADLAGLYLARSHAAPSPGPPPPLGSNPAPSAPSTAGSSSCSSSVAVVLEPFSLGGMAGPGAAGRGPPGAAGGAPAGGSGGQDGGAPVFQFQPVAAGAGRGFVHHRALVSLDVLMYLPTSMPLAQLCWTGHELTAGRSSSASGGGSSGTCCGALTAALSQQLAAAHRALVQQGSLSDVTAHHFRPPGRAHHVTVLYARKSQDAELNEAKLAGHRAFLHQLLGLPTHRPALRISMALPLDPGLPAGATEGRQQRLMDVHLHLPPPIRSCEAALVDGSYEYCHYMQDRFNDCGWGCAYRSLQTLVSWFQLQQYTSKPIPTHREVQQILVKLGDKTHDFIGSQSWIGAIELSYILDEYLGITSKIVTVNRGSDIPLHARELAAHFKSQGTPIMIGGGVLAYTLLGVAFDELTGDCAFLILDPHYTGGEDLKKIQAGTWVGWKRLADNAAAGGPLFVRDTFYNFLCPQCPRAV